MTEPTEDVDVKATITEALSRAKDGSPTAIYAGALLDRCASTISKLERERDDARNAVAEYVNGSWAPISQDGANRPEFKRCWLARQLMDSRMTSGEAFSVVAYHPSVTSVYKTDAEQFNTTLLSALGKAMEAFVPFAEVVKHDIGEHEDDEDYFRPMERNNTVPLLTVGDFRRAQYTLADIDATLALSDDAS